MIRTMKARLVKTQFYCDSKIEKLSKDATWLFMYLLTNQYIGLTGAYEISDTRILFEAKLTRNELESAKSELSKAGLVAFLDGWVIVFHTEKHNRYRDGSTTKSAYNNEFYSLPKKVKESFPQFNRV